MWLFLGLAHAAGAYDVLRRRDEVSCSALGAAAADLRGELVELTRVESQPPWVATRAAGCLVELYGQEQGFSAVVEPWFRDPERVGLAWIAVLRIDDILEAEDVARAAGLIEDPRWKQRIRERLTRSSRSEVRAVVDGSGAGG